VYPPARSSNWVGPRRLGSTSENSLQPGVARFCSPGHKLRQLTIWVVDRSGDCALISLARKV